MITGQEEWLISQFVGCVELSLNVTFRLEATVVVAIAAGVLNVGAAIAVKVCRHKIRQAEHRCCRTEEPPQADSSDAVDIAPSGSNGAPARILMPYGGLVEVDLSQFQNN
jgi:hypothetical protein